MIIDGSGSVTEAVLQATARGNDPRLKEITSAFVRHMHAFVREVRLTEQEWSRGGGSSS